LPIFSQFALQAAFPPSLYSVPSPLLGVHPSLLDLQSSSRKLSVGERTAECNDVSQEDDDRDDQMNIVQTLKMDTSSVLGQRYALLHY